MARGRANAAVAYYLDAMRRLPEPFPYVDAKLFGILLAGVFAQTRPDCSRDARLQSERPSGIQRIPLLPEPPLPERKA
jgi:hypothetical protein